MFNVEKAREILSIKQGRMESMRSPILVTIDDLLNDDQLALSIDVATGDDNGLCFKTVVLEFWSI